MSKPNSNTMGQHNVGMKYPDFAKRFNQSVAECEKAPKTQVALGKWLGFSQPTVFCWVNGEKLPGMASATKIAYKLGVSVDWLLSGNGSMHIHDTSGSLTGPDASLVVNMAKPIEPGDEFKPVRFGSLKLSAGVSGFAIEYHDDELPPLFFREDWLVKNGLKAENLTAQPVSGESMCPGLCDGDVVLVDVSKVTPLDGKVFAVNYEGEMVIKRMLRDQGQWWLTSDNPNKTLYPNKLCAGDMCIIIGQIVHKQSTSI